MVAALMPSPTTAEVEAAYLIRLAQRCREWGVHSDALVYRLQCARAALTFGLSASDAIRVPSVVELMHAESLAARRPIDPRFARTATARQLIEHALS